MKVLEHNCLDQEERFPQGNCSSFGLIRIVRRSFQKARRASKTALVRTKRDVLLALILVGTIPSGLVAQEGYRETLPAGPDGIDDFRVLPYLQRPENSSMLLVWFSHEKEPGQLRVTSSAYDSGQITSVPQVQPWLTYHEIEESERGQFPDMHPGSNYKHSVMVSGLQPDTLYQYKVKQGNSDWSAAFRTSPSPDTRRPLRIIAFADSETGPEGRTTYRGWFPGKQHEESTGRSASVTQYLVTETDGFRNNLRIIQERNPDLLMMPGDIVQGGGYQRAWDEFWFHMAGRWDQPMSRIPLLMAMGNWENFGARVGGYEPWAIHRARQKYAAYIDAPPNNKAAFQDRYYRTDFGPVTVLTLDSSNGLPDNTDNDTNINIDLASYPGDDLPDTAPGSDQWNWTMAQLADARSKGQIIFVQFHHIPYSSGGHILPTSVSGSSGQSGLAMRAYTPWFQHFGVTAVLCGHNEHFERSKVGNVLFYDVGVAGDGLAHPIDWKDPRQINPWRQWSAYYDAPELWKGAQLVAGGRHYGHLEINVLAEENGHRVTLTPVYAFPVTDEQGAVERIERRVYNDVVDMMVPRRTQPTHIAPAR